MIRTGRKALIHSLVLLAGAASLPATTSTASAVVRAIDCPKKTAPFATTPCEGVRPGGVMVNSSPPVLDGVLPDGHCTIGFLFRSGKDRYASTAGHCSGVEEGKEQVWNGDGPPVEDNKGNQIGRFVYATSDGRPGVYLDFALVKLDRDVAADPEVCHFGGPTGINKDIVPASKAVTLPYFGATPAGGYVAGQWALPARTGISQGLPSARRVIFNAHAFFGDSGAPVLSSDGRAVGIISGPGDAEAEPGLIYAPRLAPQLAAAEAALGRKLRLWTAWDRRGR